MMVIKGIQYINCPKGNDIDALIALDCMRIENITEFELLEDVANKFEERNRDFCSKPNYLKIYDDVVPDPMNHEQNVN